MKLTPDDPKLTAYALGELDEAGRKAVEAELNTSPECRRAVEEIREAAVLLTTELATEELPDLTFAQQRKIENQLRQPPEKSRTSLWRILLYGLGAAAACLMAAMLLPALWKSKAPKQVATSQNYSKNKPTPSLDLRARPATEAPVTAATTAPPADPASSMPDAKPGDPSPPVINSVTVPRPLDKLASVTDDAVKANRPSSANTAGFDLKGKRPVTPDSPATPGLVSSGVIAGSPVVYQSNAGRQEAPMIVQESLQRNNGSVITVGGSGGGRTSSGQQGGQDFQGGQRFVKDQNQAANTPSGQNYSYYGSEIGARSVASSSLSSIAPSMQPPETRERAPSRSKTLAQAPAQDRFYASDSKDSEALGFDWYLGNSAQAQLNTATYPRLVENSFLRTRNAPLSTFSIDVDTASYANMRRFLNEGRLPPRDAVRIEELINYFKYNHPQPRGEDPFAANIEVAGCPWNSDHRLVRVGLKGREIAQDKRPPSNFVFLIDVSGSMQPVERLPLIKQALRQLVKKMTANDRVAIVVYASAAGVKLSSTSCAQKETILEAIDQLGAGGSTAGAAGIQAAYRVAQENFIEGGVNRVLLCTDGDFNVGMTDQTQLVHLIQEKAKGGVFLTTLGVGTDNYKDALMQKLADKGNGNYHYLDTLEEAQKVLIDQMNGTLVTIAKDVKIQIEFNPSQVGAYRLIGYEKRMLRQEDFNNDAKDAGEIGAGHTVTALYEIVPPSREVRGGGEVDELKYQPPVEEKPERYATTGSRELLTLKLRYKQPDGNTSRLLTFPVTDSGRSLERASADFKFAAAVAEFGMLLRNSEYKGDSSYGSVLELAEAAKGADAEGYRAEFLTLVRKAKNLERPGF